MAREKSLTVKIRPETYKALVAYCREQGMLMKHVIQGLLEAGLESNSKKGK